MLSQAYSSPSLNASVSYTYDAASREQTMTAANQAQTSFSYDNADRLTGVTRGTQGVTISPDADGRRQTVALPNGVTVTYSYDGDSNVSSITYKHNGTTLGNLTYSYNPDGRVNSMGGSLASVILPAPMTATYEAENQVASYNGTNSQVEQNGSAYDYGFLTFDPSNNGIYTWNERHQLASASVGGVSSTFQYDALGRRIQQVAGTNSDNYVYDGLNAVQIQGSSLGTIDVLSGLELDDWFTSTDSYYGAQALLRDALGSTIGLVNSSGSLEAQYAYAPFGKTTQTGGAGACAPFPCPDSPYKFAGREQDPSGLYFMRARYYNPLLGRFISADASGAGDFLYANDDPIQLVDPLGLYAFSAFGHAVDVEFSVTFLIFNYSLTSGEFSVVGPNVSIGAGFDFTIDGPKSPSVAVNFGVARNLEVGFPIAHTPTGSHPQGVRIGIGVPLPIYEAPYFISVPANTSTEIQSGGWPLPEPPHFTPPEFRVPVVSPAITPPNIGVDPILGQLGQIESLGFGIDILIGGIEGGGLFGYEDEGGGVHY